MLENTRDFGTIDLETELHFPNNARNLCILSASYILRKFKNATPVQSKSSWQFGCHHTSKIDR